jgi:ABC-type thiamine transport system ATPase subunit
MAYMAQQWVTDRVREAYRDRTREASTAAEEAQRVRAWLTTLVLDTAVVAVIDEPLAALESGLRSAAQRPARAPGAP